jgi:predicted Zn-dependent protease
MISAAIGLALCIGSWGEGTPAMASIDPPPDSARARMVAELHAVVERVSAVEVALAGMGGQELPEEARDELDSLRSRMRALLDTVAFRADRGPDEIAELRRRYPHAVVLLEVEACLLERAGDAEGAAMRYERLLEFRPRDARLHLAWARNRLVVADTVSARAGFSRALDLEPEAIEPFRALVRLHEEEGTLDLLLARMERLTVLHPETPVLESRVRELLHRMRGPRALPPEKGAVP